MPRPLPNNGAFLSISCFYALLSTGICMLLYNFQFVDFTHPNPATNSNEGYSLSQKVRYSLKYWQYSIYNHICRYMIFLSGHFAQKDKFDSISWNSSFIAPSFSVKRISLKLYQFVPQYASTAESGFACTAVNRFASA